MQPHTAALASKKRKLAIHFAAGDGHDEVCRLLLRAHPEGACMASSKGKLPVHLAARWGHVRIVRDLLDAYPDGARALDYEGSLPLHDAARQGQTRMAVLLLEKFPGGLVSANLRGEIPLFPAVRAGALDLVLLLLRAWPRGGVHVLKNISPDDNISEWTVATDSSSATTGEGDQRLNSGSSDADGDDGDGDGDDDTAIIELCLRGATNNWFGCDALLRGREPPPIRLLPDVLDVSSAAAATASGLPKCGGGGNDDDCRADKKDETTQQQKKKQKQQKKKKNKGNLDVLLAATTDRYERYPAATSNRGRGEVSSFSRSKSPILLSSTDDDGDADAQGNNDSGADRKKRAATATEDHTASVHGGGTTRKIRSSKRQKVHAAQVGSQAYSRVPENAASSPEQEASSSATASGFRRPSNKIRRRRFLPLHAALECGAPCQVVRFVLERLLRRLHRQQQQTTVDAVDDYGRTALHWALHNLSLGDGSKSHSDNSDGDDAMVGLIQEHLLTNRAATTRDSDNRLPLHLAVRSKRVPVCIVEALLELYPTSAVDPCRSRDEWRDVTPVTMACHYDCDVSTVFRLLRADPCVFFQDLKVTRNLN